MGVLRHGLTIGGRTTPPAAALVPEAQPGIFLGVVDPLPNEQDQLAEEAREAQRLSPEQRVELFASIMEMIQGIWQSLPFEEQWRRLRIGETIDGPRPSPWSGTGADARP